MSASDVPERDWRTFRENREIALERLCERALRDAKAVVEDSSKPARERFRRLFGLVGERDDLIAKGFDAPRRSAMYFQLAFLVKLRLVESAELASFSAATRERVESLAAVL